MTEILQGWKVVRATFSGEQPVLKSAAMCGPECVVYQPGVWAKPQEECGPLAVFSTLRDAHVYVDGYFGHNTHLVKRIEVYECQYICSPYRDLWTRTATARALLLYLAGTDFASKVKLTKRVL